VDEVIKGRLLLTKVEVGGMVFVLMNVYAPNNGSERIDFFMKMTRLIKTIDSNVCIVVGGDWNCTTDFTIDRNGEEPHTQSSRMLVNVLHEFELLDVWRMINKRSRQYTWLKVNDNRVSGARLDRFYLGKVWNNRVTNASILPNGFSDHHMVIFDFTGH